MNKIATKIIVLAMAMMLFMAQGAGAQVLNYTNEADIWFEAGDIIIDPNPNPEEVGFEPLQLEFGTRNVPIRPEIYVANGDSGLLLGGVPTAEGASTGGTLTAPIVGVLITDERALSATTGWTYKVSMTSFDSAGSEPSFHATLTLADGDAYTSGSPSKLGTDLVLNNSGTIVVPSNDTAVLVLTATDTMGPGMHGAEWTNDEITLALGSAGAPQAGGFDVITDVAYQATLTWTLATT